MKRLIRIAAPLTALGLASIVAATSLVHPAVAASADSASTDANIARLTTSLLGHSQFAHRPFDAELAGALLTRYMDALDPSRSLFLQSDVDEFVARRAAVAKAVEAGDTDVARAIFERYLERLEQNEEYVADRLLTAKFDFTGHDVYSYDRDHAQRPRDLAAARALWWQQLRAEYLDAKLDDRRPKQQIVEDLTRRHAQNLRTMKDLRSDEVLEMFLDTLAHVYDPHSDYLGREQMESFSIAMRLSLVGIGATLESKDGYCEIRDLLSGGPASRGGLLKPGDRIVSVAQAGNQPVDIVNMPLSRAVELIRGPKGSTVTLSVIPAGAPDGSPPKRESLVRDEVRLEDQEAKARIVDIPSGKGGTLRLGVVDLPAFYADVGGRAGAGRRSATADVACLLTKLKTEGVKGVVLDLRKNGGGSLDEAISLTGLFIRTGPVVQ
ncbi:MAG TPA: S41 family peptidase, partial [Polyangiaceae bacterium]|nr:S41 family peptidase [Polyangiaceae bacterium]